MIESIKCIKNLGPFESAHDVKLAQTTLIFGENGRGKTMLSEAFRSLANDDPDIVAGRKRLGADGDPVIVLEQSGGGQVLHWQLGGWQGGRPKMAVFNDGFVEANVCSGLEVEASHLQGLHSVAVGDEGVRKAQAYTQAGADVTATRKAKEEIEKNIQDRIGSEFKLDDFVRWKPCSDIDDLIAKNQEALRVAANAARIRQRDHLKPLPMPNIDFDKIQNALSSSIGDMTNKVSEMVDAHLATLWDGAESWLNEGWTKARADQPCPYCGQDLKNSQLVGLFRHYFDAAYQDAKKDLASMLQDFVSKNDESSRNKLLTTASINSQMLVEWESDGLKATQRTGFEAEDAAATWQNLAGVIIQALEKKLDAPLEIVEFDEGAGEAMVQFQDSVLAIAAENDIIAEFNAKIAEKVALAKGTDVDKIKKDARRLQCLKLRGAPEFEKLCADYDAARTKLQRAERSRDDRRKEMSEHNENAFRRYGTAINRHLCNFNVGFQIDELKGVSPGGVVTSQFVIVINNEDVKLNSPDQSASFGNTLSGGDRTALALAFFFASLDQRPAPDRQETVVVIDDPLSSLDDGRRQETIDRLTHLSDSTGQLIVMSHDRDFLCKLSVNTPKGVSWQSMKLVAKEASTGVVDTHVDVWDIDQARLSVAEASVLKMSRYLETGRGDTLSIAQDIRFVLESFVCLMFSDIVQRPNVLGKFIGKCKSRVGKPDELLDGDALCELRSLNRYSRKYHHPDESEPPNEVELRRNVNRMLAFLPLIRRPVAR